MNSNYANLIWIHGRNATSVICSFEYGKSLTKANEMNVDISCGRIQWNREHDLYLCEGPSIVVGRKGAAGEVTIVKIIFGPL